MADPMAERKSKLRQEPSYGYPPSQTDGRSCLEEKERDLRGRFTRPAEGVLLVQGGRIVECNRFLAEKTGYAIEEVVGSIFASFFDAESIEKIDSELADDTCPALSPHEFSTFLICKNGAALKVRVTSRPCSIGEEPARLVLLSESDEAPPAVERGFGYHAVFFPEESPDTIPEYSRCRPQPERFIKMIHPEPEISAAKSASPRGIS